jgi:EAL domain-containing protein (putative c-di-GMP-specific phosphodiesterase class I)
MTTFKNAGISKNKQLKNRLWHHANRRRGERSARNFARSQRRWLFDLMHRGRLAIAFQPIYSADTPHQVFAHECLLRAWDGEALIYPDAMFHAARVLDCTACLDLAARALSLQEISNHDPAGKIFINFAPCFSGGDEARRTLRRTLHQIDELGIARERIVFEITESECLHDWHEGLNAIASYRDAGFGLALDDFGTGYSSLKLLHNIRPDYIKLDQSLLRDVHSDDSKAIISRKLIEIAQELGIATIAEGIESVGESNWAREQGADFVQGFHYAVPSFPPFIETTRTVARDVFIPFVLPVTDR